MPIPILPICNVAGVIVRFPELAPVKEPVPSTITSALSSQPINTLSEEPLSITIPASLEGLPLVPVPSSISRSSIVVFVAELVTVDPFTVRFPESVKFVKVGESLVATACPIEIVLLETVTPVPADTDK